LHIVDSTGSDSEVFNKMTNKEAINQLKTLVCGIHKNGVEKDWAEDLEAFETIIKNHDNIFNKYFDFFLIALVCISLIIFGALRV
jgi:hypothetical protein